MPRIKRWFPVSHDFNADPELWAMRHQIGEKSLSIWFEILSIADRNEGELPGDYEELVRSVSGKCQSSVSRVSLVCDFAKTRLWLVSDPTLRVRNYLKYHRTREPNEIPRGNKRGSPPILTRPDPTEPNLREEVLREEVIRITPPSSGETPDSEDEWDGSLLFIKIFLEKEAPPLTHPELLLDNDWWVDVHDGVNGFDLAFLSQEFSRMSAWLNENLKKRPLPKSGSIKRFVRNWLTNAKERERKKRG